MKGGNNYNSIIGLEKCGYFGDFLIVIHLLLGYILSKKFGEHAIDIDSKKEGLGFVFSNHQDKMTEKKVINSIIVGFGAGLIGGTLGLGGAIVLVPVWLNTGIDQEKSTSSSPPLIFFSALISFTICLLSGHYKSFM